jgi:cardiolipin synthase
VASSGSGEGSSSTRATVLRPGPRTVTAVPTRRRPLLALATAVLAVAGCTSAATIGTATASRPAVPTPAPGSLSVLVEPDRGIAPIYAFLSSARHSIDLTMYELVDPQVVQLLETAAARGVVVRVVLDGNNERTANKPAFESLSAHGVHAVWADSRYASTHEKAIVVDGDVAAVMSLNFTSRYYGDTRDFAVLDTQAPDVAAIEAVFDADFRHAAIVPVGANDLVWSPGSERALLRLIGSARTTLLVENEEMALAAVKSALEAAARRGVHVTVVMTRQTSWANDFDQLVAAHVDVRTFAANAPLYIHAKAIVADAGTPSQQAFVGSENFSNASLNRNRELGIETADPSVVKALATTIRADAANAAAWH